VLYLLVAAGASFIAVWFTSGGHYIRRARAAVSVLAALGGGATAYFAISRLSPWTSVAVALGSYVALAAAASYDFKLRLIPNIIPAALIAFRAALLVAEFFAIGGSTAAANLVSAVLGGAVSFGMLALSAKLSRGGIGAGDIKLVAVLGFACGLGFILSALVLAMLLCVIVGTALMALKKIGRKESVPFAPFVWGGYVLLVLVSLRPIG
jgi:prepilin signal peptidase PulO-like enzyme (type II secretory pathway)